MVECCFTGCKWVRYPGSGEVPCLTCSLNARAARVSKGLDQETFQYLLGKYCDAAESIAQKAQTLALEDIPRVASEETIPSGSPEGASRPLGAELEVNISSSGSESDRPGRKGPQADSTPSSPAASAGGKKEKPKKAAKVAPSAKAEVTKRKKIPLTPRQPAGPPPAAVRERHQARPTQQATRVVQRTGQPKVRPAPKPSKKRTLEVPPVSRGDALRSARDRSPTPHPRSMGSEGPREAAEWSSWDSRSGSAPWEERPQGWWQGRSWGSSGSWDRDSWGSWSRDSGWGTGERWSREEPRAPGAPEGRGELPPHLALVAKQQETLSEFARLFPRQAADLEELYRRQREEEQRDLEWPSPGKGEQPTRRSRSLGVRPRESPSTSKGGKGGGKAPSSRSGRKGGKTSHKGHPIFYPAGYRNWVEAAFGLREKKRGDPASEGEGKYSLGGGWKPRQWKDWLRQGVILPALAGEEPREEFLADFPGWAESQEFEAEDFSFSAWALLNPQHFEEGPQETWGEEGEEEEAPLSPSPVEEEQTPPRRSAFSAPIGDPHLRPGGRPGKTGPRSKS